MKHFFISTSSEQTQKFGKYLGKRVQMRPEWGSIVLLSGELGSGKTTLAKGFFEALGIENSGVKSPTFSYFQEYSSEREKVIHADLYRLGEDEPSVGAETAIEEILEYVESGHIVFIEWAHYLSPEQRETILKNNIIEIDIQHHTAENERHISIDFYNHHSINEEETRVLMEEYQTPVHVRWHIEKVTYVATTLAQKLCSAGVPIDINLVKNGALCHDLVRYVDFPNFDDTSHYQEEVTSEKIEYWKQVKAEYADMHHGAAIGKILRERGYDATAELCEAHMTKAIFREKPFSWEEKLVYYADKRALHENIVSLQKRFADGRKRYGHNFNEDLERRVFAMEQEIFEHIDIAPDDL